MTDTTTGWTDTLYYTPSGNFDNSSSESIIERPSAGGTITPLRNFWTGWKVTASQANDIGMQNFTITKYSIHNLSGRTLETTSTNSGQALSATWDQCG